MGKIAEAFVEITAKTSKLEKGLDKARNKNKKAMSMMGREVFKLEDAFKKLAKTIALVGVALAGPILAVRRLVKNADQVLSLSTQLGISAEAVQRIQFASKQASLDERTAFMAIQRLLRRSADVGLNISQGRERGTLSKFEEILGRSAVVGGDFEATLLNLADAFEQVEDPAEKISHAMSLFDSEGVAMLRMLNLGREGLQELLEDAEKFGAVLSVEDLQRADQFRQEWNKVTAVLDGIIQRIGIGLLPTFRNITQSLIDMIDKFGGVDKMVRLATVNFEIFTTTLAKELDKITSKFTGKDERQEIRQELFKNLDVFGIKNRGQADQIVDAFLKTRSGGVAGAFFDEIKKIAPNIIKEGGLRHLFDFLTEAAKFGQQGQFERDLARLAKERKDILDEEDKEGGGRARGGGAFGGLRPSLISNLQTAIGGFKVGQEDPLLGDVEGIAKTTNDIHKESTKTNEILARILQGGGLAFTAT